MNRITINTKEDFKKLLEDNNTSQSIIIDAYSEQRTEWKDVLDFYKNIIEENFYEIYSNNKCFYIALDASYDIEDEICGIAHIWKQYPNKEAFESYYRNSEMMRSLYCNEHEESDNSPASIFVNINGERYIVFWTSDKYNDYFTYRNPHLEELGLLNVIGDIYINELKLDFVDEFLNIKLIVDDSITYRQYLNICDHVSNLNFNLQNIIYANI